MDDLAFEALKLALPLDIFCFLSLLYTYMYKMREGMSSVSQGL